MGHQGFGGAGGPVPGGEVIYDGTPAVTQPMDAVGPAGVVPEGPLPEGPAIAPRRGRHGPAVPQLLCLAELRAVSELFGGRLPDRVPVAGLAEHRAALPLPRSPARLAGRDPPLG